MPWPPEQRRAIAARMSREGKSREEIRRFFHKHGHGHKAAARRGSRSKRTSSER